MKRGVFKGRKERTRGEKTRKEKREKKVGKAVNAAQIAFIIEHVSMSVL